MELFEALFGRRTVRVFENRPVPDDVLRRVLEACRWAQSWANTQCWEIVVLRDPALRARLEGAVPEANPALRCIRSAPVLLALCAKRKASGYYRERECTKFGDWFLFDLGIATQNMALAAHAQGLGSVVLGLFDQECAAEILGVPDGYELVAFMPMGYPAETPRTPKRREIEEFTHWDGWKEQQS